MSNEAQIRAMLQSVAEFASRYMVSVCGETRPDDPHTATLLQHGMRSIVLAFLAAWPMSGAIVNGVVSDAATREAIGRVSLRGCGARAVVTDGSGRFRLETLAKDCVLYVAAVGYRPLSIKLNDLRDGTPVELEIALHPDTMRRSDSVDVAAPPFAGEEGSAVALAGNELRNLGSVLADDPLRAVHSLPGVTSNDDFQSQFAIRGAGFQRTGIYLDGILLHSPFHTLQGDTTSASLSIVEGEMLESATLYPSALPPPYGDRTAGALDFRTRDGDTKQFGMRSTLSMSNAGVTFEGPIKDRGSWLAAARKSYLQYIIERTAGDSTLAFGFWDTQAKLSYQVAGGHHISLSFIDGHSGLDRTRAAQQFGLNTVVDGDYQFTLGSAAWRWSSGDKLSIVNRLGWMRERFVNRNRDRAPTARGAYGEWLWNADASMTITARAVLNWGVTFRRIRDDGFFDRLLSPPSPPIAVERYRGTGVRSGGYAQQSWSPWERLQLVLGGRFDYHSVNKLGAASAYANAAIALWRQARLFLTWGTSSQYPEISQFFSLAGSPRLIPERANHTAIGLEQNFGDRTRFRAEVYTRQDRDLLFRPDYEPRMVDGAVLAPPLYPEWTNSARGWARGFQVFVQRRAANNLTGWVAYAYGRTYTHDGVTGNRFDADYDQRHSFRVYASYRIKPTVNLSGRWMWSTGLPVRGYFAQVGPQDIRLSDQRNRLRLPAYQRVDFRINKAFIRNWGQMTLFAEVINLTNRENIRFDDLRSYDSRTGAARLSFERMFPILPSAGLVIDF